jgi:NADH-quinone oxidoreductase subunit H
VDLNIGLIYIFAISALSVYTIIMSGWSSNSKYALLGGLRAAAQMISYEVSLSLMLLIIIINIGTFNLTEIVLSQSNYWNIFKHFPVFLLFFIAALAETNRVPFDLPEAESELVSGYNVEYSSITFALFFLAEYSNILIMSFLIVIFFLGG